MTDLFTKIAVITARLFVIGAFTFAFATPLYVLLYLIIFQSIELLSEISMKCFLICYCTAFLFNYAHTQNALKKDQKSAE
jgi:amino acid transporter